MARVVRNMLSKGSAKLGESIFGWAIPAIRTCPGRSNCCSSVCYATHGRFATTKVQKLMRWRYEMSKKPEFVRLMCDEIFRRGVLVLRVGVSGDFYSPAYTAKWVEIASQCRVTRFFAYTRSWRVPKLLPYLRAFAALPNVKLWYSADRETGMPPDIPDGVRVAWLQDTEKPPDGGDLVFQVRKLRKLSLPVIQPICGQETQAGREKGVNCANCGVCWQ